MPHKQLLHLVFGGRLKKTQGLEFEDLDKLDIVGIFPDYESAEKAWKAKSQRAVDDAYTRYFVVHMHELLDPDAPMDAHGHVLREGEDA
mgnify:CR=1 FL=1